MDSSAAESIGIEEIDGALVQQIEEPVEIPDFARRDPWEVGRLDPAAVGIGGEPWGRASGAFLSQLMRGMDTPLASRWVHISLRNALLARSRAPGLVHPVDWVGERAWLLNRVWTLPHPLRRAQRNVKERPSAADPP